MDNFRKIEEENEEAFRNKSRKVHANVWGTLGFFRFVGDVLDVYVSRVFDVFLASVDQDKKDDPASGGPTGPPGGKSGPRDPEIYN